jgi:hypothetical protein
MTLAIQITSTGIPQWVAYLTKIGQRLQSPQGGLESATHAVAGVFQQNYDSEGGEVGGWADLSEYAQSVRWWQGFQPDHPILVRYGSLRNIAVDFFQSASIGSTRSAGGDTEAWSDQEVTGTLEYRKSGDDATATLVLSGSYKILNQTGHPNAFGYSDNPARPFWFVNSASLTAAQSALKKWIEDEVL